MGKKGWVMAQHCARDCCDIFLLLFFLGFSADVGVMGPHIPTFPVGCAEAFLCLSKGPLFDRGFPSLAEGHGRVVPKPTQSTKAPCAAPLTTDPLRTP